MKLLIEFLPVACFIMAITFFPDAMFRAIDYVDYRFKQFVSWIFNLLNKS